ncbi:TetR family transcriptional regulator [Pseudonocardia sp. DSM 110487]|uniref:TetR/AcrR family transcriptional regulator n=1 Tax=Pseudonocardia sp. DSM 110487 TaxID=2865833 RepID=UPI001C6A5634|nr:TetR/AcrR family transcriptional regulator [Pseudonocardia sp. DSM 110487]QYN38371.1 TetR family transcriptional regulator [Pseudonocardia sp. DSM 110487]
MPDRRTEILDGALHVLAEHGMRGLTHRAVDAAAGIPLGSTSYYFRSRSALVEGCVERLLELDLAVEAAAIPAVDLDAHVLADALVDVAVGMVTTQRYRTVARYELTLAATRDPQLKALFVRAGDTIRAFAAGLLRAAGAPDPDRSAEELAATFDGFLFTALVRGPHEPAALTTALRRSLERALRSHFDAPQDVARDTKES